MDDDDGAREAIAALQTATSPDRRIVALQSLQDSIQRSDAIHEHSEAVSEALRAQLKHANPLVSAKALSVVPAFVEKLSTELSDTRKAIHSVRYAVQVFVPLMTERLGDHRERTRDGAKGVLVQLAGAADATSSQQHAAIGTTAGKSRTMDETTPLAFFERELLEHGLRSKVAKTREMTTLVLPALRGEVARLPLRPLLPALVDHLSDADAGVRESARSVTITLFASASPTAKSELKKEMEKKGVRKQTQDVIVAQLFEEGYGHNEKDIGSASGRMTPVSVPVRSNVAGDENHATSIPSRSASRLGAIAVAHPTSTSAPDVRPVYVASSFELDKVFSSMLPHFNGKETEHNWQAREQDLVKLRGMLKTNVHESLAVPFQSGIHKVADAILKGVASLRTTLCMHGITLVSELAKHLADDLGTVADTFFSAFIRMAGFTKKIVATASQAAVKEILTNVSYKHKYFEQIAQYISEKNPMTRLAMCQHFITILNVHARHRKHALEAHSGLELISGFCKKALTDASKEVRALAREAFYRVEEVWPSVGAAVLVKLDPTSLKLVENNRINDGESAFASDVHAAQRTAMPERPSSRLATVAATPPRTPRTPGARGGPSTALLAAKRAAAAQMALQRRKEEEEEEQQRQMLVAAREADRRAEEERKADISTTAAVDDEDIMSEEEVLEEEMEEQRRLSPPPSQKRSSIRSTPVAVVTPSRASRHNTPSIIPSSIPLPSSPSTGSSSLKRPSSMLLLAKRPRTNSTSSVSSNRSVGRLNLAASGQYGSIAQRFDQSPSQVAAAARESRTSLAKSQTPSRASQIGFKSSGRSPQPAVTGPHRADFTQDTVYDDLAASFDASVHLNTPTRIFQSNRAASPALSAGRMSRSITDDKLSARGLTSPASSSVSGSATRRARPISMIPAPRTPSTALPRHVKAASDERSPSVQVSARQPSAVGGGASERRVSNGARIPSDAPRGVKWFLGKANRLENANLGDEEDTGNQLSPIKRRPESSDHVAQLAGGRATLPTFKSLVALSKDFKLPERPTADSMLEIEDYEEARKASSVNAMAKFEYDLAVAMWQEQGLFDRLFAAVSTYLQRDHGPTDIADRDLNTAALVLLHRLVDNQFGLFASLGREGDLFALLLQIIRRTATARASAAADVKSACQAIGDLWCRQTDVVLGISIIRASLTPLLTEAAVETTLSEDACPDPAASFTASMQVLAFKALTNLFARLPAEVIEEQMEHCKTLVRFGLNHRQIEVRQQAVKVIVAANNVLRDPQSIFGILQPIDRAQQDLLVYYMSKS